jgi:hypothetical protein
MRREFALEHPVLPLYDVTYNALIPSAARLEARRIGVNPIGRDEKLGVPPCCRVGKTLEGLGLSDIAESLDHPCQGGAVAMAMLDKKVTSSLHSLPSGLFKFAKASYYVVSTLAGSAD